MWEEKHRTFHPDKWKARGLPRTVTDVKAGEEGGGGGDYGRWWIHLFGPRRERQHSMNMS